MVIQLQERDAARRREERARATVVIIPPCQDRERRLLLESDDIEWLEWYFGDGCGLPDPFTYKFTHQQKRMVKAIRDAITFSWDQAIAASRGEGKTTIAERLVQKCTLSGEVDYTVLFSATGGMADNILDSIKTSLLNNDRLAADYPEVCYPVRALEGAPQRANTQRVNGRRWDNNEPYEMAETRFSWCGQEVIFPSVPGSASAGAIIATRGLDAAVRGLKKRGKRPKLAIIDDPDTEDTARSEEQAKKLETRIDRAIGGLGGQRRGIGRVVLTTLQSRISVSYRLTDPAANPSMKGERFRFLEQQPIRMDMWNEYVQLRQTELQERDERGNFINPHGRRSHALYLSNRAAMDDGAIVANQNRYDDTRLPDGTQNEASALQHYFNLIVKIGTAAVQTEYDNDPPEDTGRVESGLTPSMIQRQLSGYSAKTIPPGCTVLVQGMDVGKWALHWVVKAFRQDATGYVIDYGRQDVTGARFRSDEGLDKAIRAAVLRRMDEFAGYEFDDGTTIPDPLTLVDAHFRTDAVYSACAAVSKGIYPVMGFGQSSGCAGIRYTAARKRTTDTIPGYNWKMVKRGRLWLVEASADAWKAWEHDRWMTATDKPGTCMMWGVAAKDKSRMSPDELSHTSYAHHICSEVEIEEPHKGGIRRRWATKSKENHWLDASYYADVAASIRGIRLAGPLIVTPAKTLPGGRSARRPTAREMAARAGGA